MTEQLALRTGLAAGLICLNTLSAPAQSIDAAALWDRYMATCAGLLTDLQGTVSALEPLTPNSEGGVSEDGMFFIYESGDEDGLVGDHIYLGRHGGTATVYCDVFDTQIGGGEFAQTAAALREVMEERTGQAASGGALTRFAPPDTGLRIYGGHQDWAGFSVSGAFERADVVTMGEVVRQGYGGVSAVSASLTFYAIVPDNG